MKRNPKRTLLAWLLTAAMLVSLLPSAAFAAAEQTEELTPETVSDEGYRLSSTSGTCGDNLTWTLEDGVLTISGTGDMTNYASSSSVPWYDSRESITSVVIENGVTGIGSYAFYGCTDLTSMAIGSGVTSIGWYATDGGLRTRVTGFDGCPSLTEFQVSEDNMSFCSVDGVLFNKDRTMLIAYPIGKADTSYDIPDGVVIIDNYAFRSCTNLTHVTIPNSVTCILLNAFFLCTNLTSITIPSSVVLLDYAHLSTYDDTTGRMISDECDKICGYTYSAAYWLAQQYNIEFESLGTLTEEDDNYIGAAALISGNGEDDIYWVLYGDGTLFFCGVGALDKTTSDAISAYNLSSYSDNVQKAVFTEGISSIGAYAMASTFENLASVQIADSVTSIENHAFYSCPALTNVEFGSGLSSIANYAFRCDYALSTITVSAENSAFQTVDGVLFSKDGTTLYLFPKAQAGAYTIPDGTETIGMNAFGDCTGLTSVTVPTSVTTIMANAFDGCDSLTDIYYAGSKTQWNEMTISSIPTGVTIHYAVEVDISSCAVTLSASDYTYDGTAKTPSVTVTDGSTALVEGTDYTVDYSDNIAVGTANVTVTGLGAYTGTAVITFTIDDPSGDSTDTGDTGTGNTDTGDSDTGDTDTGDTGTGDTDTGDTGTGDTDTGNTDTGDTDTGNTDTDTGDTDTGYSGTEDSGAAHTHSYTSAVTKAATCTTDGVMTYTCSCGDSYTETIPATGHTWDEGTVTLAATRVSEGEKACTCTACGETKTEVIPVLTTATFLFSDVTNEESWYYNAVYWAYDLEITAGYDDGTFRPNSNCTRAEFATFLYTLARAYGLENAGETASTSFTDVTETGWYYTYVMWAAENGLVSGYTDGTFKPNNQITRAEAVTMLYGFYKTFVNGGTAPELEETENSFSDLSEDSWYYTYMAWAIQNGVVSGYPDGTCRPNTSCTRSVMVVLLHATAEHLL